MRKNYSHALQKLYGFHKESNKIEFAFFLFLYNFLGILQDSAKHHSLFKKPITSGSLELLGFHRYAPNSQKRPWKDLIACNVALGLRRWRFRPKSREPAARMVGERWGRSRGSPRGQFAVEIGAEERLAGWDGGVLRR
jgi:hypothetical protein